LIGLPWQQVSEAVSRFVPRLISVEGLEIPRSTGVPVVIPVTFRRELCDLEILASNECCEFKQMNEEDNQETVIHVMITREYISSMQCIS
jgi:hypothetical protein